jgi:hypothetical protein
MNKISIIMKSSLLVLFLMIFIISSCHTQNQTNKSSEDSIVETIFSPDTVKCLSGFYLGMSDKEVIEYIRNNPSKFYKSNDQSDKQIHIRIDGLDFSIKFNLYGNWLYTTYFVCNVGWHKIDDTELQEHYNTIFNLIKESNPNFTITRTFVSDYKIDWPSSIDENGSNSIGEITSMSKRVNIHLVRNNIGEYSLLIIYHGGTIPDYRQDLGREELFIDWEKTNR